MLVGTRHLGERNNSIFKVKMKYNVSHSSCDDGLASAWIMKRAIPEIQTIFSTYNHEWKYTNFEAGDKVIFTDFSPEPEDAVELLNQGIDLKIIDHHATAKEKLDRFKDKDSIKSYYHLNMRVCGSYLTWEFYFPNDNVPELLQYINIADMWEWDRREDSREVCAWVRHNLVMNDINSFQRLYDT